MQDRPEDNHVDLKIIAAIYAYVFVMAFAAQIALDINVTP